MVYVEPDLGNSKMCSRSIETYRVLSRPIGILFFSRLQLKLSLWIVRYSRGQSGAVGNSRMQSDAVGCSHRQLDAVGSNRMQSCAVVCSRGQSGAVVASRIQSIAVGVVRCSRG